MNSCSRSLIAVARPSVCNTRAPYSVGCKFRQFFYAIWYLRNPLTSTQKFYGYRPRETPPLGEFNTRWVAKYSNFGPIEGYISKTEVS